MQKSKRTTSLILLALFFWTSSLLAAGPTWEHIYDGDILPDDASLGDLAWQLMGNNFAEITDHGELHIDDVGLNHCFFLYNIDDAALMQQATIEARVKVLSQSGANFEVLVGMQDGSNSKWLDLFPEQILLDGSNRTYDVDMTEYHIIRMVREDAEIRIYVDNEEVINESHVGAGEGWIGFIFGAGATTSTSEQFWDYVAFTTEGGYSPTELPSYASLSNPELAGDPNPASGDKDVPRDASLSWAPGTFAAMHDVYLGMSLDDVNEATTADSVYMGRQAAARYDLVDLEFGQTYFWRIDEVNSPPDSSVFKGDVWDFTLEPVSYPIPIGTVTATASSTAPMQDPAYTVDGSGLDENDQHSTNTAQMWLSAPDDAAPWIQYEFAQLEKLDRIQAWNHNTQTEGVLGFGTKSALIEYSADGENWSEMGTPEIAQATGISSYPGVSIDLGAIVAQYVRISPLSNWSILPSITQAGLSEVRFYAIPCRAREPMPADGTTSEGVDITLQWRAGREAVEHEVVFSDDEQAVIDGSAVAGTVSEPAFDPGTLVLGTPYFWKINEMNELGTPPAYEGELWTFLTPDHLMIDDFEMYKTIEGLRIWEYWIDGFDNQAENGALVGNGDNAEKTVVYEGSQSMPIAYNNTLASRSEVIRIFDTAVDLTLGSAEYLKLHVIGDPSSEAASLYLILADTAGKEITIDHPDPAATVLADWDEWTIPLSDLASVNVTMIDSITVGVGNSGVQGKVFIDAIRTEKADTEE